jgi:stage III sporulation protein AD
MEMVQAVGIGILDALMAVTLSRIHGAYGLLIGVATGCLLLLLCFDKAVSLLSALLKLSTDSGLEGYGRRTVQILGLSCLTEAGSRICRDGGQGNVALKVELCGRVLILWAILPAVQELLEGGFALLRELAS